MTVIVDLRKWAMATFKLADLPDIFRSTREISAAVNHARGRGSVRRVAGSIHTKDLTTDLEVLVPTRLREVIAASSPGAVVMGRSAALVAHPAEDGSVFLTDSVNRDVELPGGIALRSRRGPGPVDIDIPLQAGALWMSSDPRQLLEHLVRTHRRGGRVARTFSREELEAWLDRTASANGEEHLNWMRDEAVRIAPLLGFEDQVGAAHELIGAFLGTRSVRAASPHLRARQRGRPYDQNRVKLLDALRDALVSRAPSIVPAPPAERREVLPFVDAYFSNYIEGTEFGFAEAASIVFDDIIPAARPADAHDIRGTYAVLASPAKMIERPASPEHLRALLIKRHAIIMGGRPEKRPGQFKERENRVGSTIFVSPALVGGTLDHGFTRYAELVDPFARAVFMMFLIAEVHPFDDGNGRMARAMMNAELVATGQAPALVPTVLRNDYIKALRAMTLHGSPDALIAVLDFGRRYASALDCSSVEAARKELERTNAFEPPDQPGIRLLLPDDPRAQAVRASTT
jgi:Fic/DOC family